MEMMDGVYLHLLLLLVTIIQGVQGQTVTPSSVVIAVNDTVSLECTTESTDSLTFIWSHVQGSTVTQIYVGGGKFAPQGEYGNFDLDEDTTAKRSTLIITSILRQDAGGYSCTVSGQTSGGLTPVTVEEGSAPKPIALTSTGDGSSYTYQATCEAIGSSPAENITWILDGVPQSDGIVDSTDPQESDASLFDTISVFTFPATIENYNVRLECDISGHQVAKLNRQETRLVDIHKRPEPEDIIMIRFESIGTNLRVTCDDTNGAAVPAMSTFYIYSNGTLITEPVSDKAVTVPEPEQDTVFTCEGSNYLGITTTNRTFEPGSSPATEPSTTTNIIETTNPGISGDGANIGAIAGGVVGGIACFVIIVLAVYCCKKQEYCCFADGGLKSSGSGKKPAGSAVGSSNGSEKDKINQPVAAQRSQAPIQHTASNPGQELYALPERKQPAGGRGGDAPDRGSGPGQNEPQDIFYAALDLSSKAGHTEKHIPKNENDVVVYSSILV